ncbi:hypothetical protein GCM10023321_50720 [Pseudonocardia eucalypti]|uniref:Cyclic nucleotide-binding domain-containing protein n=1 Tax=Pseudonocardia eucalypti TaxID=648755 RepID=A0ABP9QKS0_9PSEU
MGNMLGGALGRGELQIARATGGAAVLVECVADRERFGDLPGQLGQGGPGVRAGVLAGHATDDSGDQVDHVAHHLVDLLGRRRLHRATAGTGLRLGRRRAERVRVGEALIHQPVGRGQPVSDQPVGPVGRAGDAVVGVRGGVWHLGGDLPRQCGRGRGRVASRVAVGGVLSQTV